MLLPAQDKWCSRSSGSTRAGGRITRRGSRTLLAPEDLFDPGVGGPGPFAHMAKLDEQEQFLVTERGGIDHGNHP